MHTSLIKHAAISIALASALLGCQSVDPGNQVWYKENGSLEERDRLLAAAEVQAQQAQSSPTVSAPGASTRQTASHTILEYMTANGWRLVPKSQAKPLPARAPVKDKPVNHVGGTALDH